MKRKISIILVLALVISLISTVGLKGKLKAAPEGESTNIALASNGTTVATSHINDWAESMDSYKMTCAIDGQVGANTGFFMSDESMGMENEPISLTLTFSKSYQIDKIKLAPAYAWYGYEGCFPESFKIEANTKDGWTTIVEKSGCTIDSADLIEYNFSAVTCDSVRLVTIKNSLNSGADAYGLRLGEFEVYGVEVSDLEEGNIALISNGTTAQVSAPNDWAEANGFGIAKINDGDTSNLFFSEAGPTVENKEITVTMNFARNYAVNKVALFADEGGGFPVDFTLEAYTANGWKQVKSETGYTAALGKNECTFDEVKCSAFRLVSTKNGLLVGKDPVEYAVFLKEFAIYGTEVGELEDNVALQANGTTAQVSAPNQWAEENGFGIAMVNDGNQNNLFFSEAAETIENKEIAVTMVFARNYKVNKAVLYKHMDGGFPVDFTLEAYTADGWKKVISKTGYSSENGKNEFVFDAIDCSAFRLVSTKNGMTNNAQYAVFLSEFEIFGIETDSNISTPPAGDGGEAPLPPTIFNVALKDNGGIPSTSFPSAWGEENGLGVVNVNDGTAAGAFFVSDVHKDYENSPIKVAVGFNGTYKVHQVKLYEVADGAFPVDFTIEAYSEGSWKVVKTVTNHQSAAGWHVFDFEAIDCTAVRIHTSKNGKSNTEDKYGCYFGEFEVYGIVSDASMPTAPQEEAENNKKVETLVNVGLASNGTETSVNLPSAWGEENGYGAANLNDGVAVPQYFITDNGQSQNTEMRISLHFKQTYKVNKINLYATQDGGFPVDFKLQAYTKNGWKTVVTKKGYKAMTGWQQFKFSDINCSAVRLVGTKIGVSSTTGAYVIYLGEFEAYGVPSNVKIPKAPKEKTQTTVNTSTSTNVGLASNGTKAYTSHPSAWGEENGYGTANLNDGVPAPAYFITENGSKQSTNMKVSLHFKETYKVNKIQLYATQDGGFPVDFTLEAYTKNGWKKIVTKKGYKASVGWQTFEFADIDCSAVRLVSTKIGVSATTGSNVIYLGEFEVYGKKSSVKISDAPVEKPVTSGTAGGSGQVGGTTGFTYDAKNNIALNVPVTARTEFPQYGAGVVNVNDGNLNNFWSCNTLEASKGTTEWIELNLLDNYWVDTVVLYARDYGWGFPIDFKISVFYDDEWIEVVNKKGYECAEAPGVTEHIFKFSKVVGNKIRIESKNCNKADGEYAMQLMEVVAYGKKAVGDYILPNTNIVVSATGVTSSSALEDFGYFTKFLTDDDIATAFSSKQYASPDNKEWIELDFKRTLKMGELQLKPTWAGLGFPSDFKVEVLENNKWVEALTVTGHQRPENEAWQKFVLHRQYEASKMRITVTKLGEDFGQYSLKLNEVRVFPYATEGDNEGAVEVVDYERGTFGTAEKVTTKTQMPIGLMIAGGVMILLSVALGVVYYLLLSKKMKRVNND